jgi:hypothetical protein
MPARCWPVSSMTKRRFPMVVGGCHCAGVRLCRRCRRSAAAPASCHTTATRGVPIASERVLLDRYCVTCHNQRLNTGASRSTRLTSARWTSGGLGKSRREAARGLMPPWQARGLSGVRWVDRRWKRRSIERPRIIQILDGRKRCIGSIAPSTGTPFVTCWRSMWTSAPCCRLTV